jgi:hypothetical protein
MQMVIEGPPDEKGQFDKREWSGRGRISIGDFVAA